MNIINEAALRAVRNDRTVVTQADLEESIEVVIAGYQKKNAILSDHEKKVVSYHEIGHALVAAMQTHSAPVQKITIIPRTSGALGYTMQVEQGDKYLLTKEEIEDKICTYTAGRAAEEVVFGEITTGASNDIEEATKLARAMVTRYGMTDEFDMVAMEVEFWEARKQMQDHLIARKNVEAILGMSCVSSSSDCRRKSDPIPHSSASGRPSSFHVFREKRNAAHGKRVSCDMDLILLLDKGSVAEYNRNIQQLSHNK